jgi:hypothetical protein
VRPVTGCCTPGRTVRRAPNAARWCTTSRVAHPAQAARRGGRASSRCGGSKAGQRRQQHAGPHARHERGWRCICFESGVLHVLVKYSHVFELIRSRTSACVGWHGRAPASATRTRSGGWAGLG